MTYCHLSPVPPSVSEKRPLTRAMKLYGCRVRIQARVVYFPTMTTISLSSVVRGRRPIARPSSIPSSGTPSHKEDELSCLLSEMSLRQSSSSAPVARPPLKPTVTNALVLRPPVTSGLPKTQKTKKTKKARKKAQENETAKKKAAQPGTPAAELPITGDASVASVESMTFTVSKYEEAASFMTSSVSSSYTWRKIIMIFVNSFLSSPATRDSVCKLTLLQSLILELGLQSSALPGSLTAARALLKNRAHVNIREYIVARQQGQSALKEVLHPSRSALVKSIRKNKNPASLKWVKSQGLQVLLVNCFH